MSFQGLPEKDRTCDCIDLGSVPGKQSRSTVKRMSNGASTGRTRHDLKMISKPVAICYLEVVWPKHVHTVDTNDWCTFGSGDDTRKSKGKRRVDNRTTENKQDATCNKAQGPHLQRKAAMHAIPSFQCFDSMWRCLGFNDKKLNSNSVHFTPEPIHRL